MGGSLATILARAAMQQAPSRGAPADFSGQVLANPDNIRPMADTEPVSAPTKLSKGTAFYGGTAKGKPKMDISNPSRAAIVPGPERTF